MANRGPGRRIEGRTVTVKVRMQAALRDAAAAQAKEQHHTLSSWTRFLYDKALDEEAPAKRAASRG